MGLKKKFLFISKNNLMKKFKNGNLKRKAGINFSGKKTVRNRGFINKQKRRYVDYFKSFWHVKAQLIAFEYDPKKNSLLSLILYYNGVFSYCIPVEGSYINMFLYSGLAIKPITGASTILKKIPKNLKICLIELNLYQGSKLCRSSASFAKITSKTSKFCTIKLKSKRTKILNSFCLATVGSVFNFNFHLNKYKKASYSRFKGFRPSVRGVAMNPIDHPHGGGEGKKSKKKSPMNIWGKIKFSKKGEKR